MPLKLSGPGIFGFVFVSRLTIDLPSFIGFSSFPFLLEFIFANHLSRKWSISFMFSYRLHKVFCSNLLCFKKISAKSVIMMSSFSFLILFILSFLISLAVGLLFY